MPNKALFLRLKAEFDDKDKLQDPGNVSASELWLQVSTGLGVDSWGVAKMVAKVTGLSVAGKFIEPDPSLVNKVPYNIANSLMFLPVKKDANTIILAVANPLDENMQELVRFIFGINTKFEIIPPGLLDVAIADAYEKISGNEKDSSLQLDQAELDSLTERRIPKLARQLMKKALEKGASDLHIQAFTGGAAVRIRVDGILQRLVILPNSVANILIRYCKALSGMDPTNFLRPQDGRTTIKLGNQEYDLRMSIIPTKGGKEKLVIRFLNRSSVLKLSAKSFSLEEIHMLRRLAASPSGVILICGPTGSGKTTTLYSILSELNTEDVSISTVENPVEYNMPGLAQTEVNDKAGMTFASGLRSILRQDPDIILIGEIRDQETAQIAMQSALTGHLVFSTLHTNDALSAIPRLLDLEVQPSILTEALVGVVSQRLLRKLCGKCKQPVATALSSTEEVFFKITHVKPAFHATGCAACNYVGYDGRLVVSEMFEINSELRKLILAGDADIQKMHKALGEHEQNLSMSASRLIISGETTPEEAVRVIGRHFWIELGNEYKSELPNLTVLNSIGRQASSNSSSAVLLAGPAALFNETFKVDLVAAWFKLFSAETPAESKEILQNNEEIEFVILSIDSSLSDQQIVDSVDDWRVAMAWSRLPALLLLPDDREGLEQMLREAGATSRCMPASSSHEEIIEVVNNALGLQQGYAWGVNTQEQSTEV